MTTRNFDFTFCNLLQSFLIGKSFDIKKFTLIFPFKNARSQKFFPLIFNYPQLQPASDELHHCVNHRTFTLRNVHVKCVLFLFLFCGFDFRKSSTAANGGGSCCYFSLTMNDDAVEQLIDFSLSFRLLADTSQKRKRQQLLRRRSLEESPRTQSFSQM